MRSGLVAFALLLAAPLPALPQGFSHEQLSGAPGGVIRVDLTGQGGGTQSITLPAGKSATVDLPQDARDVLVTNPKVADAAVRSPRRISVFGVAPGQTDAVFFDAAGRRILALNIRVDTDFSAVGQTINHLIPGSTVHVDAVNNSVVLSGGVANLADADKAVQIAQQFTAKPEQVINMLSVAGKDQVMLKVRIVEVQRTVIKQLGFNLSAALNKAGNPQFLLSSSATWGVNGSLLGGGSATLNSTGTSNSGSATLEAFEQVGLARTLAEPTLTTVSGEAAKTLVGGEFPVPTGEDSTGRISIEFKPYGVGLGFTPVVLGNGRISLKISTEVSELTNQGAFNLVTSATSSLQIPGLDVTRAEDTIELPSGGSMMIAGLLKEETKDDLSSLPGLMSLPVLGALFSSRDYQSGQTEMVIIVTPYLVSPTSPNRLQTPADGLQMANDQQAILLGQLNKVYKAPPAADQAAHDYQGPAGYVIE